ncbi:DUF488 family protein [Melaminivora suipulveris]|uniref:DUF488 domain-containing protein n=1 Tax=Melaminivora suipulveris TaxID=2109913 RepID=UPI001F246BF8|nr:DUF488 domain-containing protein [Melaminivora suipulveris]
MSQTAALPFFTIGHSSRSLEEFLLLLQQAEVTRVVDIRKIPRSRANPQFNEDAMPEALAPHGVGYEHLARLGGLRGKVQGVEREVNGFWTNASFHRYADYALTPPFAEGLAELIALGRRERVAFMCSEAVWWRCHRRIVADWLVARGEAVFHIMAAGRVDPVRMTPGAVVAPDGVVRYPAQEGGEEQADPKAEG